MLSGYRVSNLIKFFQTKADSLPERSNRLLSFYLAGFPKYVQKPAGFFVSDF